MPNPESQTYIRPLSLVSGPVASAMIAHGDAVALAGGPLAFSHCEVVTREASGETRKSIRDVAAIVEDNELIDHLACLNRPREPFARHALSGSGGGPLVMGVVNVTPDSFSDGGDFIDPAAATEQGRMMFAAGAGLIDVGGESTRPGAAPVMVDEELNRVLPVVTELAGDGIPVSIDTRNAPVMVAAIEAGAQVVNDVSALHHDPESLEVVAQSDASVILMHMQGDPQTMQQDPNYDDVLLDVYDLLAERAAACQAAGIAASRIAIDPGIGFGKSVAHNLTLIGELAALHGIGCALAIGVSRKSFIQAVSGPSEPKDRLAGSLAMMLAALDQGAQIVRVHDVGETVQAVDLWRRLTAASADK